MKYSQIRAMWARKAARGLQMPNPRTAPMKLMKIEQCREGGTRRKVKVTCRDCASMLLSIDLPFRLRCRCGLTGKRLCRRFQNRFGVEIVKQEDNQ